MIRSPRSFRRSVKNPPTFPDTARQVRDALAAACRGLVEREVLVDLVALAAVAGDLSRVRLDGPRLTICDDLGRLAGIDLEVRRVTHLVRV